MKGKSSDSLNKDIVLWLQGGGAPFCRAIIAEERLPSPLTPILQGKNNLRGSLVDSLPKESFKNIYLSHYT